MRFLHIKYFVLVFLLMNSLQSCKFQKKEYYITGELMECYEVKWPSKGIVRHGKSVTYLQNGAIIFSGGYWNNMLDGLCKDYYENGQLEYSVKYEKGRLIEVYEYRDINNNKLDYGQIIQGNGYLKKYTQEGKLLEEGKVLNGLREGKWKVYSNIGFSHDEFYNKGIMVGNTFISNTF